MQAWWARPLEAVYAAVFIDAIMVKIRDGQVRNRPVYAAIGVDLDGHKDILGMWAGEAVCGASRASRRSRPCRCRTGRRPVPGRVRR
jgi:transposase-like protein